MTTRTTPATSAAPRAVAGPDQRGPWTSLAEGSEGATSGPAGGGRVREASAAGHKPAGTVFYAVPSDGSAMGVAGRPAAGVPARVAPAAGPRRLRTAVLVAAGLGFLAALPTAGIAHLVLGPLATWAGIGLLFIGAGCLLAAVPSRRDVVAAAFESSGDEEGEPALPPLAPARPGEWWR